MGLLLSLASTGSGSSTGPAYAIAANNTNLPVNYYTEANWVHNAWSTHKAGPAGYTLLKAAFSNWIINSDAETQGFYDFTLRAGIYYNGVFTPFTFGGAQDVVISRTYGTAVSDPLAIYLPPGAKFFITNRRVATDNGAAGSYNVLTSTSGIPQRQDGIVAGTDSTKDFTLGVGAAYGASVTALTAANVSGGVIQNNLTVATAGTGYTSGPSLRGWYGAAGVNQPGSEYAATTQLSGFGNRSGSTIASITVSSGGVGHDSARLPPVFLAGGGGFGAANQSSYGPSFLMGVPVDATQGHVLLLGDSITSGWGSSDSTGDLDGNHGIYEQAVKNQIATAKLAGPGNSATGWLTNSTRQQAFLAALKAAGLQLDKAVIALGTNDFLANPGIAVASLQATIGTIRDTLTALGARSVFGTTVIRATTGTYTATGTQTVYNAAYAAAGKVDTYNAAVRSGTPALSGYLDAEIVLRDAADPTKWRVDGTFTLGTSTGVAFTSDGIHPNLGAGIPYARLNLAVTPLLPAAGSSLLLEDGSQLLMEDTSQLLLES